MLDRALVAAARCATVTVAPKNTWSATVVVARRRRIDDFGDVEPLDQEADAAVDLAQALLAVDVVAVLGAVAVAGRPGDRRDELRPLLLHELLELARQARESARRHVVARAGRQRRDRFLTSSSSSASVSRVKALFIVGRGLCASGIAIIGAAARGDLGAPAVDARPPYNRRHRDRTAATPACRPVHVRIATRASPQRPCSGALAALACSALAALAALALALAVGSVPSTRRRSVRALAGDGIRTRRAAIVRELRLPRALAAFAVGGLLALAGALMQVLLRNPLADPYVLGISGGAAVGALARDARRARRCS